MKDNELDTASFEHNIQPWESEMVVFFTSLANMCGFRKSVGAIYGYMYSQESPMHMEAIMSQLGMSKGTVSQGLTFLRKAGAIRLAFVPGDRREHFVPEVSLKKLVSGFLRDQIYPHLESGEDRIANLEEMVASEGEAVPDNVHERIKKLRSWHKQAKMLLPFVQKFIDPSN